LLFSALDEQRFKFDADTIKDIVDMTDESVQTLANIFIEKMDYTETDANPDKLEKNIECMIQTPSYFYFKVNNSASAVHDQGRLEFFKECVKEALGETK
jgi:hypothetical protein